MNLIRNTFLILALGLLVGAFAASASKVVGYFPYWAQYSQFYPKDVRFHTVSHIHYTSLTPAEDGSLQFADGSDQQNFESLAALAAQNQVKLVAVVGGLEAEATLQTLAASPALRTELAQQALSWVQKYQLAGVELDWQNLTEEQSADYSTLLQEFVSVFAGKALVTASVYPLVNAQAYAVAALSKLDYVTVFYGDQMTEDQSTLKPNLSGQNITQGLELLVSKGVSSELLVPVALLYGKSYMGAKDFGDSHTGFGSGSEGYLPYKELMEKFDAPGYEVRYDASSMSEIAVSATESIVFTGIPSLQAVARWVRDNNYGGVAAFDLSQDHPEPIVSLMVTLGKELRPQVDYRKKR